MTATRNLQRTLLVVLVVLVGAIGVVLLNGSHGHSSAPARSTSRFEGPTMPPGLRAANFVLRDQHGRTVSLAQDRGHVVILTFIHSLCHDACPLMVEQIKGALNALGPQAHGVAVVGITVAPSEDTPANRRRFLAMHEMQDRLAFLNGPLGEVRAVWRAYAIQPGTAPQGHSAFVLLIDRRGGERVGFPADQLTPEALAHDIRVLEQEHT